MEDPRPPKARLTIRVGVTGHRLEALKNSGLDEQLLRKSIRDILVRIKVIAEDVLKRNRDVYSSESPALRVISPIAEGADQFVADEACKLCYEIQSPLPFSPQDYKTTFKYPESAMLFDKLVSHSQTTSIFTLDGSLDLPDPAYEAVGRVVLRQSDLLIAVWDGKGAKGQGGTGQIVREALSRQIPVLWISLGQPHSAVLLERITEDGTAEPGRALDTEVQLTQPEAISWRDRLKKDIFQQAQSKPPLHVNLLEAQLRGILEPPSHKELKALQRFLAEPQPEFRAALFYRVFCRFFVSDWPIPERELQRFETAHEDEWRGAWHTLHQPNNLVGIYIERHYRKPFIWADVIADICADRYRSSFAATYILGALAVLAALLGTIKEKLPPLFSYLEPHIYHLHGYFVIEFVLIGSILLLVYLNKTKHWHERWIDYRLLAEGFRQMRVLSPFARVTPSFEVPAHLIEDAPASTWVNWYFRSIVRQAGLVHADADKQYLAVCRTVLGTEIKAQADYHHKNELRNEHLHERLHRLSITLFILTFVACFFHLFDKKEIEPLLGQHAEGILTLCAIFLPAFGAAIQGILHQGESGRLARRSRSIKSRLEALLNRVNTPSTGTSFRDLGRIARSFSEVQIHEQTDWRSVFIMKDVSLP